jgi:hypothetical protein
MAYIAHDDNMTVIILDNDETSGLVDLLCDHPTLCEDYQMLDELTNKLLGME